jgi:hypothetical protein
MVSRHSKSTSGERKAGLNRVDRPRDPRHRRRSKARHRDRAAPVLSLRPDCLAVERTNAGRTTSRVFATPVGWRTCPGKIFPHASRARSRRGAGWRRLASPARYARRSFERILSLTGCFVLLAGRVVSRRSRRSVGMLGAAFGPARTAERPERSLHRFRSRRPVTGRRRPATTPRPGRCAARTCAPTRPSAMPASPSEVIQQTRIGAGFQRPFRVVSYGRSNTFEVCLAEAPNCCAAWLRFRARPNHPMWVMRSSRSAG